MVNADTGEPLAFEILVVDRGDERLALALQQSLRVAGIDVSVRQADSAQYWERILKTRDFDMIHWIYGASLSPGNEQLGRWSKIDADTFGRLNFAGAVEPGDRRDDRRAACGEERRRTSSPRCGPSTGC